MAVADVLVVDDDSEHLAIFRSLLGKLGHSVTLADNGYLALRFLQHKRFDLVLADVVMPLMDGAEFRREAAKMRPDLPVVFVTGHRRQAARLLGEDAPMLFKPVSTNTIESVIRERVG